MSRVGFSIDKWIVDEDSRELVKGISLKKIDLLSYLRVYDHFDLLSFLSAGLS